MGVIMRHFHEQPEPAGLRGRPRRLTSKAHLADEVAEAAPMAAALPAAGTAAQPALLAPSNLPAEGKSDSSALRGNPSALQGNPSALQETLPALQGTAGKGLTQAEDTAGLAASADKGSLKQKKAEEKAAQGKAQLEGVAKLANELQPTGSTLSTMQVHTKVQPHPSYAQTLSGMLMYISRWWSSLNAPAAKLLLAGASFVIAPYIYSISIV